MTSPLRDRLRQELRDAVERHGLVVWQDDEASYRSIASDITPGGADLLVFEGSWMDLRHRLESALGASTPPDVVVYLPVPVPSQDPLAEARAAGYEYAHPLRDLIRVALRTYVAESQIEAIAEKATTLDEAEQMASAGGGAVSLAAVLGQGSDAELIARALTGKYHDALSSRGAWPELQTLLERYLGVSFTGIGDELVGSLSRQLVLDVLDESGALVDRLRPALAVPTASQRAGRRAVLDALWKIDQVCARHRFRAAETELSIGSDLPWSDGLAGVDILLAATRAAEQQAVELLGQDRSADAAKLAEAQLHGRLVSAAISNSESDVELPARWRAVRALADLAQALDQCPFCAPATLSGQQLVWYSEQGWRVDRAHRRLELSLTALAEYGELEEAVASCRQRYESWLDLLIQRYTGALGRDGFDLGGLTHQTMIHPKYVSAVDGQVAYLWVDALRFEFAEEIAESLRQAGHTVDLIAAVAAVPTITPVGMAALCPGAATGFGLDENDGTLRVTINGVPIKSVADRIALMRGAHGEVADLELGECVQKGEKALAKQLEGAKAVVVRSQELDSAGENGLLSAQWSAFDELTQTLPRVVSKLSKAGVRRVVITADHGFIALSRRLGDAYKIDAPMGGTGELHRRAWIGRGGTNHDSVLRLPLGTTGAITSNDLSILVPRELALFKAGGSKQFFHGGLSPQELIVPVIVADLAQSSARGSVKVGVDVVGGKIATAMFAASLSFIGDLFTQAVRVRLVAKKGKDVSVARVAAGDGYDEATGTVTLSEGNSNPRLMFQVTKALDPDDDLELQVVDAGTDALLGKVKVAVAAPIRTAFDELNE